MDNFIKQISLVIFQALVHKMVLGFLNYLLLMICVRFSGPYIEWPNSQRANKTTSIILVSTLPTSIVITIGIVYVAYIYIKKKYRISTRRSEAVVARRNQGSFILFHFPGCN